MSRIGFGFGHWHYGLLVAGSPAKYLVTSTNYAPTAGTAVTITAQLTDASGIPVFTSGVVVTWTKSDPGGSFSSGTSTTNGSGVATVTFTTSSTPSTSATVTATDGSSRTGTSPAIMTSPGGLTPDAAMLELIAVADGGQGQLDSGTIAFYTGTRPASTADAPSGVTFLGDFTFASPAAPLANLIASNSIAMNVIGGTTVTNGTVTWARATSFDNAKVYDFDVALGAGTNTIVVNTTAWVADMTLTAISIVANG